MRVQTSMGSVGLDVSGQGDAILLLRGFPQTRLMWRDIAPNLSDHHTVVVADLPGYGESDPPRAQRVDERMSKRLMAQMLVEAMAALGHDHFSVAGHDRGGRVAYRMALDHAGVVSHLIVMDVLPIAEVWARADSRMTLAFWPYSFLAQPAPLPETLLLTAPEAVVDDALNNWGTPATMFQPEVRNAYVAALRDAETAASICDEYRAASDVDRRHDEEDQKAGRRITAPTLVLWDEDGGVGTWYRDEGGPIGVWERWATTVTGQPMSGGHFFPEFAPAVTSAILTEFLSA